MFSICPPNERWARKNFDMRGASLLKNNLNKVRTKLSKPNWIGDSVWDRLCEHWRTEGFKKKSTQAKINRTIDCGGFGGSLHTGGSITTSQHRANLAEFTRIWEEIAQRASEEGTPLPNEFDVWRDVAGVKKRKVYGLGLESTIVSGRPYYQGSSSSSSEWVRREELEEIRRERDDLLIRLENNERETQLNNKMIQEMM
ncbi:putative transposase, Ptta/En/Spm, plant [Sesbania bispinosa]|nr:putative transposase, Ptta/En/Spm, plant [Sesbania bispinosa]